MNKSYYEQDDLIDKLDSELSLSNKDFDRAADWLREVVKQVYIDGDVDALESALEELCHLLEVTVPNNLPVITSKVSERSALFNMAAEMIRFHGSKITENINS